MRDDMSTGMDTDLAPADVLESLDIEKMAERIAFKHHVSVRCAECGWERAAPDNGFRRIFGSGDCADWLRQMERAHAAYIAMEGMARI